MVCTGNICRSPIGEQVLRAAVREAGLADAVTVSSAGTGDWHVGQGANETAVQVLTDAGYPSDHTVRQISPDLLATVDLALAADRGHLAALQAMTDRPDKVRLLRSFDPGADGDEVPDPYGGPTEGYRAVLAMTKAAVPGILDEIRRRLS